MYSKMLLIGTLFIGLVKNAVAFSVLSRRKQAFNRKVDTSRRIIASFPTKQYLGPRESRINKLFSSTDDSDPVEELSEERKANLFQFLLRDLQVEGVPLLEVDAGQVHTLQAAVWTTMAELSEQEGDIGTEESGIRACLIFESIPVAALRSFVDDFMVLKTQQRLMEFLPELERFSLSLVGKGVGPAILVEVAAQEDPSPHFVEVDGNRCQAAMRMFTDRIVARRQVSGYPTSEEAPSSEVAPMFQRVCSFAEPCHILSAFWTNICELLASPPGKLQSTMLSLPAIDTSERFGAIAELLSRSLCLFKGDEVLELLHFYPRYNRNEVYPPDKPAHGHIPPISWLKPMLRQNGNGDEADQMSEEDLVLLNYERRSPVAAVCIVPVDLFEANVSQGDAIETLQVENGTVIASGVESYSRSLIDLSSQGQALLDAHMKEESDIIFRS